MVKGLVIGFILGVLALVACVYLYFATGRAPVAMTDPEMPFEKMLARKALHARIDSEKPQDSPVPADEANFLAAAEVYRQNCAVCHGLPNQPQTTIAQGLQMCIRDRSTRSLVGLSRWRALRPSPQWAFHRRL